MVCTLNFSSVVTQFTKYKTFILFISLLFSYLCYFLLEILKFPSNWDLKLFSRFLHSVSKLTLRMFYPRKYCFSFKGEYFFFFSVLLNSIYSFCNSPWGFPLTSCKSKNCRMSLNKRVLTDDVLKIKKSSHIKRHRKNILIYQVTWCLPSKCRKSEYSTL